MLDSVVIAGRKVDLCEVSTESCGKLLLRLIGCISDDCMIGQWIYNLIFEAKHLAVLDSIPEKLIHFFISKIDIVDIDQHDILGLVWLFFEPCLFLDSLDQPSGGILRVDGHLEDIFGLLLWFEYFFKGPKDASCLATHFFPFPNQMLLLVNRSVVHVLVEHVPNRRNVKISQVPYRLFPMVEFAVLTLFVFAKVQPKIKWIFFIGNWVIFSHILPRLVAFA